MSKIVVVGANHAGTAAINTLLDNYDNEVIVFDGNSNISFLGCGMALWIGKQIEGPEGLFYANQEMLQKKGATINMETQVDNIDYAKQIVYATSSDGKKYEETYDKLILATGSLPIIPNIEGKDLDNVQQVKLYQNAEVVIEKLENKDVNNVVVVGAGYIGVELAEAFERVGKNVTMIDVENTCLSGYYDEALSKKMEDNLSSHNIQLAFNEKVIALKGNKKVEKVITDKNEYEADMVILAIGFKPNSALGKDHLDRFRNEAFLVDKTQKTSDNNVYAIGDCATVYDNAIQDTNYIALATNAVRSGIIAAHNASGTCIETLGVQGSNGISIYGLHMVSTGLSYDNAKRLGMNVEVTSFEDLQKPGFIKENTEVTLRIVYDKETRRIVGAQMASRYDMSMGIHMFSLAIQEKVTIDKLKLLDIFFLPHFNQPYNYITMAALHAK